MSQRANSGSKSDNVSIPTQGNAPLDTGLASASMRVNRTDAMHGISGPWLLFATKYQVEHLLWPAVSVPDRLTRIPPQSVPKRSNQRAAWLKACAQRSTGNGTPGGG